ncbi:MAG: HlyD family secretion protein [Aquificaceae bacterium]
MRRIGIAFVVLLLILFALLATRWIKHRMDYAITDAVFVKSDELSNVGFRNVSGQIIRLYKDVGDKVKEGEVIAQIDPADYKAQLESIRARIESLKAQRDQLLIQMSRVSRELKTNHSISELTTREVLEKEEALKGQLAKVQTELELAKKDKERYENLLKSGVIPRRTYEEADTRYRALLEQDRSLKKSIDELKVVYKKSLEGISLSRVAFLRERELKLQIKAIEKEIESLEKQEELSENNLRYTELLAPFDGVVAKKYTSIGDVIKPGMPIYALIKDGSLYVEVLMEESKLKGIQKGCKAYIRLDAYPNRVFEGAVESISPASAATFALVPRDISAGEFTKVVQRIPIKIRVVKGDISLLRVGMGGEVEIERVK